MIGTKNVDIAFFLNRFSLKKDLLFVDKFIFSGQLLEKTKVIGESFSKALDPSGELFRKNINEIETLEKLGLLDFYKKIELKNCYECRKTRDQIQFKKLFYKLVKIENSLSKTIQDLP